MKINEEKYINSLLEHLNEGVLDMPEGAGLEEQMETLSSKMLIAKKMLGLANRLTTPEDKRKHKSRVLGIMNQIRAALARVVKQIEAQ